ncbi:papain-like cysteine peptidase [Moumouvirus maliensis]|nr:papain-like cysteine peptidase [Moumouvirus maliensis]
MTRYISLGSTCGVSYQLQKLKMRGEAMPFDWIKTVELSSIINVLESGFLKFLNFDSLKFHNESIKHPVLSTDDFKENTDNTKSYIYKNNLGMIFYHDFNAEIKSDNDENYIMFRDKYVRRFDRLSNYFSSGEKLVFIRDEHKPHRFNTELVKKLYDLLSSKMENGTTFKLIIIINNPKNKKYEWIKEAEQLGIKIVNDTKKLIGWKRDDLDWISILDV